MSRRFWREFGFPGLTLLLAGAAIHHFTVGHQLPAPAAAPTEAAAGPAWPPAPDTTVLEALPLPLAAPVAMRGAANESQPLILAEYEGTLTLDGGGLHFRPGPASRLEPMPGDETLPLDSVALGVAEADSTGWRIVARGKAFVPAGAAFAMPPLLSAPGVRAVDLPHRWPVLLHWYRVPNAPFPGEVSAEEAARGLPIISAVAGTRADFAALLEQGLR